MNSFVEETTLFVYWRKISLHEKKKYNRGSGKDGNTSVLVTFKYSVCSS